MKKRGFLYILMTFAFAAALCLGSFAIVTTDRTVNAAVSSGAEGEDAQVSPSADIAIPSYVSFAHPDRVRAWTSGTDTVFQVNYAASGTSVTVPAGIYTLQCWGARGGGDPPSIYSRNGNTQDTAYETEVKNLGISTLAWNNYTSRGGAGGFAAGVITLSQSTTFYLYTGGAGVYGGTAAGGFNGGGNGYVNLGNGGGGGGTDIRVGADTINHRILVAGGGGGADNVHGLATGRGTDDDGSGGAGGGAAGEPAFIQGTYQSQTAVATDRQPGNGTTPGLAGVAGSFYQGAHANRATDTGGGGGGWYGGGASNHNQGGGGGGSGYVLTTSSYRPSGYAFPNGNNTYCMTTPILYTGVWADNGMIRIIMHNAAPTSKNTNFGTVARTATLNVTPTGIASDTDLNVAGYGEVLKFSGNQIFTDANVDAQAAGLLTYVSQADTSIVVRPQRKFSSTRFHATVVDKYGIGVTAYFTIDASSYTAAVTQSDGLKNNGTGIYGLSAKTGTNYPSIAAINASTGWGAADIYNKSGTGRRTYMITRPLEPAQADASIWNGYGSATVNVSDLAAAVDKVGASYLDSVYIMSASTGSTANYNLSFAGAAGKYTAMTITPLLASVDGWFSVTLSIGLCENISGAFIDTAAQRISVDVVFRIGNARPTAINKALQVTLDNGANKTGSVSISQIASDPSGNALSFYSGSALTDKVKVPQYEYFGVDKYNADIAFPNYNVGNKKADAYKNAESDALTGFEQTSIYTSEMNDPGIYSQAYVQYSIDGNTINFTALRATRSQYSRAGGLGDFYILVHLTDPGDPRDVGLWFPIAIKINDVTAPDVRALNFTMNAESKDAAENVTGAADSVIISPYYISNLSNKGIGAADAANYNTPSAYTDYAIGRDADEFSVDLGVRPFNDFLYINSDFAVLDVDGIYGPSNKKYSDYIGCFNYVKAEKVPLYAPASLFSRLTSAQKTAAGITVNGDVATFGGIKLTAITSTKDKFVEIPLYVTDTFGHTAEVRLAVKVNNRAPVKRDTINNQGIAEDGKTYPEVNANSYITYKVPNLDSRSFKISAYDLVYDADVSTPGNFVKIDNVDRQNNNSNPSDRNNAALSNAIYADSEKVYLRDSASAIGVKADFGHDRLSFNVSSLPVDGSGPSIDNYTQNRFTGELKIRYYPGSQSVAGGSMDYLEITPVKRSPLSSAYMIDDVQITDSSGEVLVTVNIAIEVENSLPTLKDNVKNGVFYLTADYLQENANSSQPGGDTVPDNFETTFNTAAYNVREFNIREIATDIDSVDIPSLEIIEPPKLGYLNEAGVFVEQADYSKYVTVDYNILGTGNRSNFVVTRITAKSSTQALPHGLYIQLRVTDGFNNKHDDTTLAFQVEVLNSAPVFDAAQFEQSGSVNGWELELKNRNDVTSERFIAADKETAEHLINAGIGSKAPASNVKYLARDYDLSQHIALSNADPEKLPTAALKDTADDGSVAVWFTNPYAADAGVSQADLAATVSIVYFIHDEKGGSGLLAHVDPSDPTDLARYTDKTLAQCLEGDLFTFAVRVKPVTNFAEAGLELTINFRDSSPEGGHTQVLTDGTLRPTPYHGTRAAAARPIVSSDSRAFLLTMGTLGMTKNLIAYGDPNVAENNNKYFAYYADNTDVNNVIYEKLYPAETFYYNAIDLEKDAAGNDVAVSVPVSYLAIPELIADDMAETVDFKHSYELSKADGSPARYDSDPLTNMLQSMSLYDPVTGLKWTGAEIRNNPYLDITVASEADIIATGACLNENLYYSNTPENVAAGQEKILKRDRTKPLREDTFGFTLKKKNVRSNGYLELSVNLSEYRYEGGGGAKALPDMDETVKLMISCPNDNMQLSGNKIELSSASLTAAAGKNVEFRLGTQDGIISLINDDGAKQALSKTDYRLFSDYDKNDYAVLSYAMDNGTRSDKTYKENAYFLWQSFSGNFLQEQLHRILDGTADNRTYGSGITDAQLSAYFGVAEGELSQVKDGTLAASVNPGYTNFFTVSPSNRDDKNISFHPVRRISVDERAAYEFYNAANGLTGADAVTLNSAAAVRKTAIEQYIATEETLKGLKVTDDLKIYYPFKAIVYDDYEGTGFMNGSYQLIEIDVFIGNSAPTLNIAMVTQDTTDNKYYYDIDIAKGETYTLRISDFFGDINMQQDSSRRFKTRETLVSEGSALALNTSDYFAATEDYSTLSLINVTHAAGTSATDVGIAFNGNYRVGASLDANNTVSPGVHLNDNLNGYIRFTAINRTKEPVKFEIVFADSEGRTVTLTFRVTISNQAPVMLTGDGGQTYVKKYDITMKTGESFTLLPTSWDRYLGALGELGIPSAGLNDNFYSTLTDAQKTALAERGDNSYQLWSMRKNNSSTSMEAYNKFDYSRVGAKAYQEQDNFVYDSSAAAVGDDKHLGYLALADDDLPWGLKFKVGTSPFGVSTKALEYVTLNTWSAGNYAMAYQFRAVSSCSNVPVTVTVSDAEGKTIQFTFRVTVVNSQPYVTGKDDDAYGITYNEAAGEYSLTLKYGESVKLPINALCSDNDVSDRDNLKTYRYFNGSAFSVDNINGSSFNDYISVEDGLTSVTIRCNDVYLDTEKTDTTLVFYVVDAEAKVPVQVKLRIYTRYGGLSGYAAAEAPVFEVDSVAAYEGGAAPSELSIVGGGSARAAGAYVADADFGAGARYKVDVYALFDLNENDNMVYGVQPAAALADPAAYKLMSYDGALAQPITYNTDGEEALARLNKLRSFVEIAFKEDGAVTSLTPVMSTIGDHVPVYFAVEKVVSNINTVQGIDLSAGVAYNLTVKNSAPKAVGNTVVNNNAMQDNTRYLTVKGRVGYEQTYPIWNKERADLGLFRDDDGNDELEFVSAEVVGYESDGEIIMPDGWQKTDTLKCAYNLAVSEDGNSITASIQRKAVNAANPSLPYILPVKVTVRDLTGEQTSTVITFEIHNSAPSFNEFASDKYEVADDGDEFLLEMKLKYGQKAVIDLEQFLSDADIGTFESFSLAKYEQNEELSLHGLDYSVNKDLSNVYKVKYITESVEEDLFGIRLSNSNNLRLEAECLSKSRGRSGEAVVVLRDSSLEATPKVLRLRFTVANTPPVKNDGADPMIYLVGGDQAADVAGSQYVVDITQYLTDENPDDITGLTHMRIYATAMGTAYTGEGTALQPSEDNNRFTAVQPSDNNPFSQLLVITPIAGRYGSQNITVYVKDDGGDVGDTDSYMVSFELSINIAMGLDKIPITDQSLPYMRGKVITTDMLIPSTYLLGYTLIDIKPSVDNLDSVETTTTVNDDGTITCYVKAVKQRTKAKLLATFRVGGENKTKAFYLTIEDNNPPNYLRNENGELITQYTFDLGQGQLNKKDNSVTLKCKDLFEDPEGDEMRFISASSTHTFIVAAGLSEDKKELKLTFKANGSSTIKIVMTDVTNKSYTRNITVTNHDLPDLNLFIGIIQSIVINPWLYAGIALGVIVLLVLIMIILAVRRKKKRQQAEIEALLVSEMQLEEQMMKLAAAQGGQTGEYLLPQYSNPQNPNMLLGSGMAPTQVIDPMNQLPPGIDPAHPDDFDSGDGFDENGF